MLGYKFLKLKKIWGATLWIMRDRSSLTWDWTWAPCIGNVESEPLDPPGRSQDTILDILKTAVVKLKRAELVPLLSRAGPPSLDESAISLSALEAFQQHPSHLHC